MIHQTWPWKTSHKNLPGLSFLVMLFTVTPKSRVPSPTRWIPSALRSAHLAARVIGSGLLRFDFIKTSVECTALMSVTREWEGGRENNQEVDERTECPVDELHKGLFSSSPRLIKNKRMQNTEVVRMSQIHRIMEDRVCVSEDSSLFWLNEWSYEVTDVSPHSQKHTRTSLNQRLCTIINKTNSRAHNGSVL